MAKIIDNYILLEQIGTGTFGEIHKGRNLISKEAVAVKTIKLDKFLHDNNLRDMIINEIQALKKLEDPYIIKMIKMLKSANNIYLVYEYLQGIKLSEHIQKKINENEAVAIFIQIVKSFNTLQREKIVKKNLNMDNIYIHEGNIKQKNFFICKSNYSQKKFGIENYLNYVAPEVLIGQQAEDKCDVFSAGLVFFELLTGKPLINYTAREDLIEFYTINQSFNLSELQNVQISMKYKQLIESMVVFDKDDRIGWEKVSQLLFDTDIVKAPVLEKQSSQESNKFGTSSFRKSMNKENQFSLSAFQNSELFQKSNLLGNNNSSLMENNSMNSNNLLQKVISQNKENSNLCKLIADEIVDKRSKIAVIFQALKLVIQENAFLQNLRRLPVEILTFFLMKKAAQISSHLLQNIRQFSQQSNQKFKSQLNRQQMIKIIEIENTVLLEKLEKFKNEQILAKKINLGGSSSFQKLVKNEIENDNLNEQFIDEQLSSMSQQIYIQDEVSQESLILGHLLIDIGNLQQVFKRFLTKKRLDIMNHPYFKKLSELSEEKLQENFDNKVKMYENQRNDISTY